MKDKRWLLWITLGGLALRLAVWFYYRSNPLALVTASLPDDALYYFTIARNLAHGYGISFDAVHPTNGMHPLWLFIITPVFWIGLTKWGAIYSVLLMQSVLDACVVWLIGSTVYDLLPEAKKSNRRTAAGVSALLYAGSALVIVRSINGLETTLTALLIVIWLRAYLRLDRGLLSWSVLGLLSGLLLLARTDMFLVLLPVAVFRIGRNGRNGRDGREWTKMLTAILVAAMIVAPWLIWNIVNFGTPIQSSAEAVPIFAMRKYDVLYGTGLLKYTHLLLEAGRNALKPFLYAGLGLPLLTILYAVAARRKTMSETERTVYLLTCGGVLLLVVHSLFRGFIREWYVLELIPLWLVAFGVSIGGNAGKTEARASGRWLLASMILVLQLIVFYPHERMPSQSAMVIRGVPMVQELTKTAKVASFNSGYYSYFASRPGSVVDLDGVVSAEAVEGIKHNDLRGYLTRDSVGYILDFRGDFGGYVNLIDHHLLDDFALETQDSTLALVLYRRKSVSGPKLLPLTQ